MTAHSGAPKGPKKRLCAQHSFLDCYDANLKGNSIFACLFFFFFWIGPPPPQDQKSLGAWKPPGSSNAACLFPEGKWRRENSPQLEGPFGGALIVLGGPAMLIGLGGGAASSMASGASCAELDFASVQRENPEMQRRYAAAFSAAACRGAQTYFFF